MKKYIKDYKLVTKYLPNGRTKQTAEYTGKYYICRLSKTELIKKKLYHFTLVLCSGATVMGVGLLDTSGSRVVYVALPYVLLLFPVALSLIGVIRFATSGNRLNYEAYDKTKNRIHRSAIGQVGLSLLTIAGDLCYLFFGRVEYLHKEIIFMMGIILTLFFGILLYKIQKKVIYEVEEPLV